MKHVLLFCFVLIAFVSFSQWSGDPENPMLISNELNNQNAPQAASDGAGGAFIFWLDDRTTSGKKEVYGQHVDSDGMELWEPGGRLILTDSKDIEWFRFQRYNSDGKMIMAWYAANDGFANPEDKLWVQELDSDGAKVWESDLALSEESPDGALSVGYFINVSIKRDALGFQACMMISTYGYDRIRMTRFSEEGNLEMALNGVEIGPLDFGNVGMTSDGGTGAYIYYSTGNGAGAALMCQHVDAYGNTLWPEWVSAADANGLSYQFSAIGDELGVTFMWQGNGVNVENLYARRLWSDGTFDWSGEVLSICSAPGSQGNFHWTKVGDDYIVTWADGRPGVVGFYAIYAQKFNTVGIVGWAEDGVQVADLSSYGPTPRVIYGPDDFIYISHQSTVDGYVFQKLDSDGNVQWDANGEQISNVYYTPGAGRVEFVSGDNLLSVWERPIPSGGTDEIYINRLLDFSPTTIIQQFETACDVFELNEVVYEESGTYMIDQGKNSFIQLELTILESSSSELTTSSCNSYTLNGTVYDASGTYEQVIQNTAGCDSTITLHLTIETVDDGIVLNENTLTASQDNASYNWVDCETGMGVGENAQSFTPTENGLYGVNVTLGSCTESSECILVNVTATPEFEANDFMLYPNPVEGVLQIGIRRGEQLNRVMIYDMTGRLVYCFTHTSSVADIDVSYLEGGCYTLVVEAKEERVTRQFIKQ